MRNWTPSRMRSDDGPHALLGPVPIRCRLRHRIPPCAAATRILVIVLAYVTVATFKTEPLPVLVSGPAGSRGPSVTPSALHGCLPGVPRGEDGPSRVVGRAGEGLAGGLAVSTYSLPRPHACGADHTRACARTHRTHSTHTLLRRSRLQQGRRWRSCDVGCR